MKLAEARLCLDCEELHTEDRCPMCASDAFAFVTRWIPPTEQKTRQRRPPPTPSSKRLRWMTGGATGLALLATARWLSRPSESAAQRDENVDGVIGNQADDEGGENQGSPTGSKR
jgi:hypothetical protein